MVKVGGMHGMHPPLFYEIRPVNARAVRILLECILVQRSHIQRRVQYLIHVVEPKIQTSEN